MGTKQIKIFSDSVKVESVKVTSKLIILSIYENGVLVGKIPAPWQVWHDHKELCFATHLVISEKKEGITHNVSIREGEQGKPCIPMLITERKGGASENL